MWLLPVPNFPGQSHNLDLAVGKKLLEIPFCPKHAHLALLTTRLK
jgi:hypothetical protein